MGDDNPQSQDQEVRNPKSKPGLRCRKCGCRHFYTVSTDPGPARVVRYKRCRNCGRRHRTVERIDAKPAT